MRAPIIKTLLLCLVCNLVYSQSNKKDYTVMPPKAKKSVKKLTIHNDTRLDNYFWMRLSDEQKNADTPDQQTTDVLDYLDAENEYLTNVMGHTEALQGKLYTEIVSRIKKDDTSVPIKDNGYEYYVRYEAGNDYPLYCRKNKEGEKEEVILNTPKMAENYSYYGVGGRSVSPNNKLLAYGIDTISRRQYTLYFKDLETGQMLNDVLSNTNGSAVWANDNKTVLYAVKDPATLRQYRIYKHVLGTDQSADQLVYEEEDDTFRCWVGKTKSKKYLVISSSQTLSTEHRVLDANTPEGEWKIVQPREKNLEYWIDHFGDHFYIRTNLNAKNFKLVKTPILKTEKGYWEDVVSHRDDVYFQGMDLFQEHLVLQERKNGLRTVRIMNWNGGDKYMNFDDPAYVAYTTSNLDFNTNILRYGYNSLTTPNSIFEYNMDTGEKKLLKQTEVVDDTFSSDNYMSERMFVSATDGTKIPVSIVYKKGTPKNKNTPLLLYAYGSYGNSTEPTFSSTRLSLLNRGFIYAIAHVRGGQEMGRDWYENGKLLKKKNTFTDFIDVGNHLVDKGYTSKDHLYAYGGSAGGLLMGAVLNMAPDLWKGVVAAVPFVDVVSTMLDESIPLTTFEFDEWGNPKNEEYYHYIKSYSPYDNVEAKNYPNILITTGYWDSQVQYWEPAKWIAKLRDLKTDDNLLIMDCNMKTGHGGASGRFERYKRTALTYAFLLDLEGIKE